jgi:undecaprenyl-diphosphatase
VPAEPDLVEPRPGGPAERFGERLRGRPAVAFVGAALLGYVLMTATMVALGLLLTKLLLPHWGIGVHDEDVNDSLARHRSATLDDVSFAGSELADLYVIPALAVVVAAVLAIARRFRLLLFMATALIVEAATYRTTIVFVHRTRPTVPRLEHLTVNASFPSGHVAASIAVYAGLALLIRSWSRSAALRRLALVLAVVIPICVALSRMYRGMHHPTDTLGGAAMGLLALTVSIFAVRAAGAAGHGRG